MEKTRQLGNVALLATSHNVTKSYISALYKAGIKPNKVILLVFEQKKLSLFSKLLVILRNNPWKVIYKKILNKITAKLTRHQNNSDTKNIENAIETINDKLKKVGVFTTNFKKTTKQLLQDIGWGFDEVSVSSINDQSLIDYLNKDVTEKYIIFSSGGILRNPILSIGKRFIHVHPGVVPEVKGADCLLWSALLYDEIGMSSFFMNKGIDTGDIIHKKKYEVPRFDIPKEKYTLKTMKDLLINYVDPHFRAEHLVAMFKKEVDPEKWDTHRQNPAEGKQYYFMHNAILPYAVSKFLYPKNNKEQA